MVTRKALILDLVVRIYRPQPKRTCPPLFDAVKGGGEVKKKQRCFVKRFAALVSALMLCASLCVPAFASNNAQWRKWVITDEAMLPNEQGTNSKYFQLTPFQDGAVYAAVVQSFTTKFRFTVTNDDGSFFHGGDSFALNCYNYPDWWRSAIPLGALSYIEVVPKFIGYASSPFASSWTSASTARLYFFDSNNRIDSLVWSTAGNSSNLTSVGGYSSAVAPDIYLTDASFPSEPSTFINIGALWVNVGKTYRVALSSFQNIVTGWPFSSSVSPTLGVGLSTAYLTNLSSDRLVMGVRVNDGSYCMMTAEFTFWVDANKLPSGLKVGDEFPADSDSFDDLRESLIDQFPEAAEIIENGKSTLTGWNDTETVDTDVASSAMSALNAMFQNLGSFLFIVSLMVFGAVVLRMFIKKAVDG